MKKLLSILGGVTRHTLTTVGGYLLAHPDILPPEWAAAITALGVAWSAVNKAMKPTQPNPLP